MSSLERFALDYRKLYQILCPRSGDKLKYFSSSSLVSDQSVATEPAVFELACVLNNVKHVVICGHSDCKAVNLLYDLHTDPNAVNPTEFSPLRSWVHTHGARSMNEFFRIEQAHFRKPLLLNKLNKKTKFPAYVDVDEKI